MLATLPDDRGFEALTDAPSICLVQQDCRAENPRDLFGFGVVSKPPKTCSRWWSSLGGRVEDEFILIEPERDLYKLEHGTFPFVVRCVVHHPNHIASSASSQTLEEPFSYVSESFTIAST